jgi:hypothetical protein
MSDIIRVGRNASGNCVVFYGQTNPVYFNACLSAEVIDTDYISVKNDIATGQSAGTPTYEYYRIHFSKWQRDDLSVFSSAQEVADYLNEIGNVTDVPTGGYSFQGAESLDFTHDETKTSILFSNGDHHGINSVKAVGKDNGKIGIQSIRGDFEFYELEFASCTIGGVSAGNTLQTVANNLNAFFTLSAQTAPIPAPVYTQQDGVDIAWIERETIDPVGTGLYGKASSGTSYHGPRVYTSETINEPGEYFTFEAKNVVAGGGPLLGLGLYSVANGDLTEIEDDTLSNSGHHGYFFSTWLYNYSGYTAPWTTYGSASGLSYGPGWSYSGNVPMFRYSDANTVFRHGEGPVDGTALFKVGITDSGFVGVWYYDYEQPGVDAGYGLRSGEWILLARSSTPVPAGEYGLMVKIPTTSGQIMTQPKRFATDPAAPTLYYRYIESPDGEFHYPLFATEEEANYVSGDGTNHQHMYADDTAPGTVWYMPNVGGSMDATSAPVDTAEITYTEIPTQDDSNFVPSAYADQTITVDEGDVLNVQLQPQDTNYVTTIGGIPAFSVTGDGRLIGTAPEVTGDSTSNPSDTTTVTVYRTNDFGTSQGTLTIVINNITAPTVDTGDFTVDTGSIVGGVLQADSLADLSTTLSEGDRIIIPKAWVDAHIAPNDLDNSDKVFLGVLKASTSTSAITLGDFNGCFRWEGVSQSTFHYVRMNDQLGASTANISFSNSGASIYDYALEIYNGDFWLIACNMNALNTEPAAGNGGSFSRTMNCGPLTDNGLSAPYTVKIGTYTGTVVDLDDALTTDDITKISIPAPAAPAIVTPWTKALDFSGSAERAQPANDGSAHSPMKMGTYSVVVPGNGGLTAASSEATPWATTVVFKSDGNSSNQHIWNIGEGSGSGDDNIYLRLDSIGGLYFGWGRTGALNECALGNVSTTTGWHGVYIGFTGERLSGADATAANLAGCFEIHRMGSEFAQPFDTLGANLSTSGNWTLNGGRMDRTVAGDFTIGGRGANRNFHGQVASSITTTLMQNSAMPDSTEIQTMITDPVKWLNDYKVGNPFRYSANNLTWHDFLIGGTQASWATQIWLMGDGNADSYSNMIRNIVKDSDQNYTKLNMLSMVSNDIQTVNIPGLT